jgi:hypothetical protein
MSKRALLALSVLIPPLLLVAGGLQDAQGDWKSIIPVKRGTTMSVPDPAQQSPPVRFVRLIFEYEGDRVRLIVQQPVDTALASLDAPAGDHPGYFVDSRDASDATLARVAAHNAFAGSVEVFPEWPGEPITRVDAGTPKGAFTVVVPAPEATHHVTVLQIKSAMPQPVGRASVGPPVPEVMDLVTFPFDPKR